MKKQQIKLLSKFYLKYNFDKLNKKGLRGKSYIFFDENKLCKNQFKSKALFYNAVKENLPLSKAQIFFIGLPILVSKISGAILKLVEQKKITTKIKSYEQ